MEARPILSFFTKAVANLATALVDKPILPISIQDLPPHERPSPPPSPCIEVVVIGDSVQGWSSAKPLFFRVDKRMAAQDVV